MVQKAPEQWMTKMRELIPKVLFSKLKLLISDLNTYIKKFSTQVVDVETFINLKLAVEEINKNKETIEAKSHEINDILQIIREKDIKIPEFDTKLITEKEALYVDFEKRLDNMLYYIENNLAKYRKELKDNIHRFDKEIKIMSDELNNDILNVYNEENYSAIFYIEDKSVPIKKLIDKKEFFKQQEILIEIDDKSSFKNLEDLVYEYELKSKLWYSVREFQDMSKKWENCQVQEVAIDNMETLINEWVETGRITLVDLESPIVPRTLLEKTKTLPASSTNSQMLPKPECEQS